MENVKFVIIRDYFEEVDKEYAIIDKGNGEFISMPKAIWDEQQAQKELGGTL